MLADNVELRKALLDFIADFANWDNAYVREYLDVSRLLTTAGHIALGGQGTSPLVFDPFAGGGAIPLEAQRVGAEAFATDLNPLPILLNTVLLDYIPRHGQHLVESIRKWGAWIVEKASEELREYFPADDDGAVPIAYIWARTIQCEGPSCKATVPLIKSLWLARKPSRAIALGMTPRADRTGVDFSLLMKQNGAWLSVRATGDATGMEAAPTQSPNLDGTVKRGAATCPCCGYTTPVARVRAQLKSRRGGAGDATIMAVITSRPGVQGRFYRVATSHDWAIAESAAEELKTRIAHNAGRSTVAS